jgi:hypothetical protein
MTTNPKTSGKCFQNCISRQFQGLVDDPLTKASTSSRDAISASDSAVMGPIHVGDKLNSSFGTCVSQFNSLIQMPFIRLQVFPCFAIRAAIRSPSHSITSPNLLCLFLITLLKALIASLFDKSSAMKHHQRAGWLDLPLNLHFLYHAVIPRIPPIPTFALHHHKCQLN